MKSIRYLILFFSFGLSLVGCGGSGSSGATPPAPPAPRSGFIVTKAVGGVTTQSTTMKLYATLSSSTKLLVTDAADASGTITIYYSGEKPTYSIEAVKSASKLSSPIEVACDSKYNYSSCYSLKFTANPGQTADENVTISQGETTNTSEVKSEVSYAPIHIDYSQGGNKETHVVFLDHGKGDLSKGDVVSASEDQYIKIPVTFGSGNYKSIADLGVNAVKLNGNNKAVADTDADNNCYNKAGNFSSTGGSCNLYFKKDTTAQDDSSPCKSSQLDLTVPYSTSTPDDERHICFTPVYNKKFYISSLASYQVSEDTNSSFGLHASSLDPSFNYSNGIKVFPININKIATDPLTIDYRAGQEDLFADDLYIYGDTTNSGVRETASFFFTSRKDNVNQYQPFMWATTSVSESSTNNVDKVNLTDAQLIASASYLGTDKASYLALLYVDSKSPTTAYLYLYQNGAKLNHNSNPIKVTGPDFTTKNRNKVLGQEYKMMFTVTKGNEISIALANKDSFFYGSGAITSNETLNLSTAQLPAQDLSFMKLDRRNTLISDAMPGDNALVAYSVATKKLYLFNNDGYGNYNTYNLINSGQLKGGYSKISCKARSLDLSGIANDDCFIYNDGKDTSFAEFKGDLGQNNTDLMVNNHIANPPTLIKNPGHADMTTPVVSMLIDPNNEHMVYNANFGVDNKFFCIQEAGGVVQKQFSPRFATTAVYYYNISKGSDPKLLKSSVDFDDTSRPDYTNTTVRAYDKLYAY